MASVLHPFVTSRSWLRYDESPLVSRARTDHLQICRHKPLLKALYEVQPNLSFRETTVHDAMAKIIKEKVFGMSALECEDWSVTMARRLRNMLRCVSQAKSKRPHVPWVRELPIGNIGGEVGVARRPAANMARTDKADDEEGFAPSEVANEEGVGQEEDEAEEEEEEEGKAEDSEEAPQENEEELPSAEEVQPPQRTKHEKPKKPEQQVGALREWAPHTSGKGKTTTGDSGHEVYYGFDREVCLAWRAKGASARREVSLPLTIDDEAEGSQAVLARWPDGDQRRMPELSMDDLRMLKQSRTIGGKGGQTNIKWTKTHQATSHRLRVVIKQDRNMLVVLEEQTASRCQVVVKYWGDESEESIGKAIAFMIQIGEKYAADEIPRGKLYQERDKMMEEAGLRKARTSARGTDPKVKASAKAVAEGPAKKRYKKKAPDGDGPTREEDASMRRVLRRPVAQAVSAPAGALAR